MEPNAARFPFPLPPHILGEQKAKVKSLLRFFFFWSAPGFDHLVSAPFRTPVARVSDSVPPRTALGTYLVPLVH
jgi:hypothetical protein